MENYFKPKSGKTPIQSQTPQVSKKKIASQENATLIINSSFQKMSSYKLDTIVQLLEQNKFTPKKEIFDQGVKFTPFFLLSDLFQIIEQTQGKDSISKKKNYIQQVFEFILQNNPQDIIDVYQFCILKTDVEWLQQDLGIGQEILTNAVRIITGMTVKQIRDHFRKIGDLGQILQSQKQGQNTLTSFIKKDESSQKDRITFNYVMQQIRELPKISGEKSKQGKENLVVNLLRNMSPEEGKFLIRFLNKNLKIGGAEKLFQKALSQACCNFYESNKVECFPNKVSNAVEELDTKAVSMNFYSVSQKLYSQFFMEEKYKIWEDLFVKILTQFPNIKILIENILQKKLLTEILKNCSITLFTPCKPMLAKPTKALTQIFDRLQSNPFTCEYKYDGLRGQIHYRIQDQMIEIFSRNMENLTTQYPDIVQLLQSIEFPDKKFEDSLFDKVDSFIVDSEIVAYDKKTDRILPFQTLSKRARKNVEINDDSIQVCIFVFDILYLNDTSLINKTFRERRNHLHNLLDYHYGNNPMIKKAQGKDCIDVEEIQEYLNESVKGSCEGLMVKTLDYNSTYEPAKRSFKWLKVKKDYIENGGVGDSLDLVVIGANYGKGKRTGKFGVYLMACYDADYDTFESCCFVGTGFSDQMLNDFHDKLNEFAIDEKPENYLIGQKGVDVWLEPKLVWEIKCSDIQVSPIYKCSYNYLRNDDQKGLGLRFPRFIRERDDKHINNATSPQFIYDIYKQQAVINLEDEEDYY